METAQSTRDVPRPSIKLKNSESLLSEDSLLVKNDS